VLYNLVFAATLTINNINGEEKTYRTIDFCKIHI
jgi:hypothetical protein